MPSAYTSDWHTVSHWWTLALIINKEMHNVGEHKERSVIICKKTLHGGPALQVTRFSPLGNGCHIYITWLGYWLG